MKQKATHPFLQLIKFCVLLISSHFLFLAILQRKVIVFSFSRYLPQLSQGYFARFKPHDRLWEEGGALRRPTFILS